MNVLNAYRIRRLRPHVHLEMTTNADDRDLRAFEMLSWLLVLLVVLLSAFQRQFDISTLVLLLVSAYGALIFRSLRHHDERARDLAQTSYTVELYGLHAVLPALTLILVMLPLMLSTALMSVSAALVGRARKD